jgi:hypothetical protein
MLSKEPCFGALTVGYICFFTFGPPKPIHVYPLRVHMVYTSKNARALQREGKICLFALFFSGKGFTTGYDRELYITHNS